MSILQFSIAFTAAAIIAVVSLRLTLLDRGGAIAAIVLGTIVFTIGGWSASIVLMLFFSSGSLLSKLTGPVSVDATPGTARNWKQVLANGWLPAVALLAIYFRPDLREEMTALFLGAFATAGADTFATEFGIRYARGAISLATLQPIEKGLSGGVSLFGLLASIFGALVIALGFKLVSPLGNLCQLVGIHWFFALILAGFGGALADSWLGATIQVKYRCARCDVLTEEMTHCGVSTEQVRGFALIDNNMVNAISIGIGGLLYVSFLAYFG